MIMALVCIALLAAAAPCLAQRPELRFEKIVGDVRGRGMDNLSVAVTDQGVTYLLMRSGRVAVFGPDGAYRESRHLSLGWPQDGYALAAEGERVFLGNAPDDFPWVFEARRAGEAPGRFRQPRSVVQDAQGNTYVADAGNRRVQLFAKGQTATPKHVWPMPAAPIALAVRGGTLAVLTDDNQARLYRLEAGGPVETAKGSIPSMARAAALGPTGDLLIAYSGGWDWHQLCRYRVAEGGLELAATLAPSYMAQWPRLFPAGVPLTTGPDGEVWFGTDILGALVSLNPETDMARERARGLHRPLAVAFDAAGAAYVTGYPLPGQPPEVTALADLAAKPPRPFLRSGALSTGDVPFWGLLPAPDGGLYVRVVEEGWQKGWPAFTFKKVYPDGRALPFLDFGPLYGKRRTFHPTQGAYSLCFDTGGNVLFTALPLVAVVKTAPDGKVIWEASVQPRGGADAVHLLAPRDLAVDSRGNIWVVDAELDQLLCLSPEGKLLLTYGGHAGVDDTAGKGFDGPTGVAVARAGTREFLYVGDAGNQRLVKFALSYP